METMHVLLFCLHILNFACHDLNFKLPLVYNGKFEFCDLVFSSKTWEISRW